MTNDYYNLSGSFNRFTLARAEVVAAQLEAVAAGFAKLPDLSDIRLGMVGYCADTGSANTIVAAMPTTATAYVEGMKIWIKIAATNTGATTINIDGLGAVAVKTLFGDDPSAGDLVASEIHGFQRVGSVFRMMAAPRSYVASAAANAAAAAASAASASSSAGTASTAATTATSAKDGILNDAGFQAVSADLTGDDNIGAVALKITEVETVADIASDVEIVANAASDIQAIVPQFIGWDFSTTVTMADPGSGNMRLNHATVASVTAIAVADNDNGGSDMSPFVNTWANSTDSNKGTLTLRAGSSFAVFTVTGLTDNTGWTQIAVTYVAGNGSFTNGAPVYVSFARTGNAGSGDVEGPAVSVNNRVALFSGATGKSIKQGPFTLPTSDGTNGQVLTTDGAGAVTFSDPAAGGAWTLIGTQEAASDASLTQTGLDDTYDTYMVVLEDVIPASDGVIPYLRFGDSGGIDSGASDYSWGCYGMESANGANWSFRSSYSDDTDAQIRMSVDSGSAVGSAAGETFNAVLTVSRSTSGGFPSVRGDFFMQQSDGEESGGCVVGQRVAAITLDRVQILFSSGNIASGRMSVYGVSHS